MTEGLTCPYPFPEFPTYPLDPLTLIELGRIRDIILSSPFFFERTLIDRVELLTPPKCYILQWDPSQPLKRKAIVTTYSPTQDKYLEYKIRLSNPDITPFSVKKIRKARPAWTYTENANLVSVVIGYEEYKNALKRRGITEEQINDGTVEPNTFVDGRLDGKASKIDMPNLEGCPSPRAYFCDTLLMDEPYSESSLLGNWYVYPVEGVYVWFDANTEPTGSVLKVVDTGVIVPVNRGLANINIPPNYYYNDYRNTQKPIYISMPEPSFNLDNNLITWQRWRFRYSLHQTVGLIINQVEYNDVRDDNNPSNWRSILYQANFHEALTLYGSDAYFIRNFNFLDFGEYQYRLFGTPLELGVDVPPYATTLNPTFIDDSGNFLQIPQGLAIYEEDGGLLWRHWEFNTGIVQGRRARNLVLTFATCVGNYDYLISAKFCLDGSMKWEIEASGFLEMAGGFQSEETSPLVHEKLIASNHQHFFGLRLDWMIDGKKNSVYENNDKAIPSIANNAWISKGTLLKTSGDSRRNINPLTSRSWSFTNDSIINKLGYNPGYTLWTQDSVVALATPAARIIKRAPFTKNSIYVTKYKENQQCYMGNYPVEKGILEGVVDEDDDCIVNKDLVAWITLGFSHVPSAENFPILNSEKLTLNLIPENFFTGNPAMNVDINTLIDPDNLSADGSIKRRITNNVRSRRQKR